MLSIAIHVAYLAGDRVWWETSIDSTAGAIFLAGDTGTRRWPDKDFFNTWDSQTGFFAPSMLKSEDSRGSFVLFLCTRPSS